jgi:hypothetical protein
MRLGVAGLDVVIGSRDAARAAEVAAGLGDRVRGAGNADAATSAPIVIVSVPWEAHEPTLSSLRAELAGRIVVDMVNPLAFDERGATSLEIPDGSAAEQARRLLPESTVVAGFHHVSAKVLQDAGREGIDTDVLICGDDREAVHRVMELANLLPGARAVDAGPLRLAHQLEGLTAVILSVNRRYRTNAGLTVTDVDLARSRD